MFPSAILTSSGSKSAKTPPLLEEEMSSHFDRQALHPLSLRSTLAKLNRIEKGQAGHLVGHLLEMKLCNSQRKGDYDWNSKSAPI